MATTVSRQPACAGPSALENALARLDARGVFTSGMRRTAAARAAAGDVNQRCFNGQTALMLAAREGNLAVARMLCQQPGVDVNVRTSLGRTALIFAAHNGHVDIVRLLLARPDTDVNLECRVDGTTALLAATAPGHEGIVRLLLRRPEINVNKQNATCWTALMLASYRNFPVIVKMLLRCPSVDLSLQNRPGANCIAMAAMKGNAEIVWHLIRASNSSVKPDMFPDHVRAQCMETLICCALRSSCRCKAFLQSYRTADSPVPRAVMARILALAFGSQIVVFERQDCLDAVERVLAVLARDERVDVPPSTPSSPASYAPS